MNNAAITINEFNFLIQPLIGTRVSRPEKIYGTEITLELGNLTTEQRNRFTFYEGEYGIYPYCHWRIENDHKVLFGSSCDETVIIQKLAELSGVTVTAIELYGKVPELKVSFSNGLCLKSMALLSGNPKWNIRLNKETILFYDSGKLWHGEGFIHGLTPAEETMEAQADAASQR